MRTLFKVSDVITQRILTETYHIIYIKSLYEALPLMPLQSGVIFWETSAFGFVLIQHLPVNGLCVGDQKYHSNQV